MGGLSRKAYQINQQRISQQLPALAVEGGALLFKSDHLQQGQEEQARITARGIARALDLMHVRAAAVAPQDLAAGVPFLLDLDQAHALSWLSMNLVQDQDNSPVFSPYCLVSAGSLRIALLGLTDSQARVVSPYRLLSWQDTLPKVLREVREQVDMVILLSSYPEAVNMQIARENKEIHMIIQAGHRYGNRVPRLVNNTLLCQTEGRGKYQGMMRIHWNGEKTWGQGVEEKIQRLQNQLDRIEWQLHRMEKRRPVEQLRREVRYNQLQRQKTEINDLLQALAKQKPEHPPCTYQNRFIALKTSLPQDPEVEKIVDEIRVSVNRLNRKMLRTAAVSKIRSDLSRLTGWQQCAKCHPEQAAFWQQTDHALAWSTLEQEDQQYNRECLVCHVTVPRHEAQPEARASLLARLPADLKNVGCESCHGPGQEHVRAPEKGMLAVVSQSTCLRCHTQEHDDSFDFEDKLDKVRCPKSRQTAPHDNA